MDFFGIGPFEVLLVLLIAFIIFGPERLLEMSKKAGRVMGDLTRSVSDLNAKVNEEMKGKASPTPIETTKTESVDGKKAHQL
jgi:sec-independent protein translocase protein TatA